MSANSQLAINLHAQSPTPSDVLTPNTMKKVNGIGGIFFKCQDPNQLKAWYDRHLGFSTDAYGMVFESLDAEPPHPKAQTVWSPFAQDTKYFQPGTKDFMINYRVNNIEALVAELKASGVVVTDEIATYPYGKFVHVLDLENNLIELWEPAEEDSSTTDAAEA